MKFTSNSSEALDALARDFDKHRNGRHPKGVKYSTAMKRRLLRMIDQGVPAREVLKAAGIKGQTLARWRQEEGHKSLSTRRVPVSLDDAPLEQADMVEPVPRPAECIIPAKSAHTDVLPKITLPSGIIIEIPAELLGQAITSLREVMPC